MNFGESWVGGLPNPLIRLRGRWGHHMSAHPESSDRSATTPAVDLANLGAQLSEVLNNFNELNMEMTVQWHVID